MFTVKTHKLCGDEDFPVTSWIYLHGELEDINGYDLVYIEEDLPVVDGIFDCIVTIDDKPYPAKFFFWKCECTGHKGLIAGVTDDEGLAWAKEKFDEKPEIV